MPRVVLNAVIGGANIDIISHFFQYYRDIGVDKFNISVNIVERQYDDLEKVLGVFDGFEIDPLHIWIGPFKGYLKERFMKYAEGECLKGDWILRSDQDEFTDFEMGLKNLVNECEEKGYLYVEGNRIERMTVDGSLPSIKRDSDIFNLFPIKTEIKDGHGYGEGRKQKIVLAKKKVRVCENSFHFLKEDLPFKYKYPKSLDVHHFRWSNDVINVWERRLFLSKRKMTRKKKQIAYIFKNKNTINMDNVDILE